MGPSSVARVTCTIMPTCNSSKSPATTALRVKYSSGDLSISMKP